MKVFYDKKHGICTRGLTLWLMRVLRVSVGVLIPTGTRRTPISARAHLQLGGSLVPRSTRLWLKLPHPYSLGLRALVMGSAGREWVSEWSDVMWWQKVKRKDGLSRCFPLEVEEVKVVHTLSLGDGSCSTKWHNLIKIPSLISSAHCAFLIGPSNTD